MRIKFSNILLITAIVYILGIGIYTVVRMVNSVNQIIKNDQIPYPSNELSALKPFKNIKVSGEGLLIIAYADQYSMVKNNKAKYTIKNDTLFIQLDNQNDAFKLFIKEIDRIEMQNYTKAIFSLQKDTVLEVVMRDFSQLFLQCKDTKLINAKVYNHSDFQIINGKIQNLNLTLQDRTQAKIFAQVDTIKGYTNKQTSVQLLKCDNLLLDAQGKVEILSKHNPNINIQL